ncbi:hypothetical protein B7463_g7998, partial [Scytalidium lignicola]
MATPRRPLSQIDNNITPYKDLSPYIRGKIIGKAEEGKKIAHIAKELNVPDSTVRDTIKKEQLRTDGKSNPKPGRPDKYSERFKRRLIAFVRKEPKSSMAKIRKHMEVKISNKAITRILDSVGIWHWRCKRRPYLTDEIAAKRLTWCLKRKDWELSDFLNYIFTDECSAERRAGGITEWAWFQPKQKWDKEMVTTYSKSKDISVMVWAAIWWSNGKVHKSELVILDRDFESKKFGYTANSYIKVIDDQLPKIWEPGLIFMQDNTPIHCANKVKQWFKDMAIPVTDWPPYSPDLNPIEHVWWHLKAKVLEIHPELKDMGKNDEAIIALENALIEAWDLLDDSIIQSCLESLCKRRDAVIAAKGWHTKY